jgi:aminoglycoside phosphotransferase (APT) family kinase protein
VIFTSPDVVLTSEEAAALEQPPLVVIEPLEALLDELGIGVGPLTARPLGDGHSNVTYLLQRGPDPVVLRRPPRPPYPASAHDVVREARLLIALREAGLPVPQVLAIVEDPGTLGVPFVLVAHVPGHAISTTLPDAFASPVETRRVGEQLVDALVEIHGADVSCGPLSMIGRPTGYLDRQLRRFASIREAVATRPLPDLDAVQAWLAANRPDSPATTLVHGDYRLGNMLYAATAPARLVAVLDWEMATLGDPLADLGYLCATWAQPGDDENPMLSLSAATRSPGFPTRGELAARYEERTGRDTSGLGWYETFALWKSAIFLEASYGRHLDGTTSDPYFATLGNGIPRLAMAARSRIDGPGRTSSVAG